MPGFCSWKLKVIHRENVNNKSKAHTIVHNIVTEEIVKMKGISLPCTKVVFLLTDFLHEFHLQYKSHPDVVKRHKYQGKMFFSDLQ